MPVLRTLGGWFGAALRCYKRGGPTDLGGWFGVALRCYKRGGPTDLGGWFGVALRCYKRGGPTDLGGWFWCGGAVPWLPSSTAQSAKAVSHRRRCHDFSLPWANRWRRLLSMPNAGTVQERIAAPDPVWVAPPAPRLMCSCASAGPDTRHFNLDVAGSAAQFNQSVSAVPANRSRSFPRRPQQGTADTVCKGWPAPNS